MSHFPVIYKICNEKIRLFTIFKGTELSKNAMTCLAKL